MSSYNQRAETTTVADAVGVAEEELRALWHEMAELCAGIAGRFPNTYEKIAKYQEALRAFEDLDEATDLTERIDLDWEHRDVPVVVTVGVQTRRKRAMSQQVRLANAVTRLTGAATTVRSLEGGETTASLLYEIIETVAGITFPHTYG